MVMLVSLQQAKEHLRIDSDDGDNDLTLKIHGASGAVLNYIRSGADLFLTSAGEPLLDSNLAPLGIPYEVQAATLLMIGYLDRNRDSDEHKAFQMGFIPPAVTALLYPYRDPMLR